MRGIGHPLRLAIWADAQAFKLRHVSAAGTHIYEALLPTGGEVDARAFVVGDGDTWVARVTHELTSPASAEIDWKVGTASTPEAAARVALAVKIQGERQAGFTWLSASTGHAATIDQPGEILQVIPAEMAESDSRGNLSGWIWSRTCPALNAISAMAGGASPAAIGGTCDSRDEAMMQAAFARAGLAAAVAEAARALGLRIVGPVS